MSGLQEEVEQMRNSVFGNSLVRLFRNEHFIGFCIGACIVLVVFGFIFGMFAWIDNQEISVSLYDVIAEQSQTYPHVQSLVEEYLEDDKLSRTEYISIQDYIKHVKIDAAKRMAISPHE